MWGKVVVGGIIGLIIGHFAAPGYLMWALIGVIVGYVVNLWTRKGEEGSQAKS